MRAQALAHLAWHASEGEWAPLAAESAPATEAIDEPYQHASGLARPIRVYLDRCRAGDAERWMAEAISRLALGENPVSRADALNVLWDAAVPYPGAARDAVLAAPVDACASPRGDGRARSTRATPR